MSVQVRGRIQNPQPGERAFERMTSELSERIIALEKEVRRLGGGTVDTFTSPGATPFGPGVESTTVVNNITQGETNHGLLVGLEDDDHPQYVQHYEGALPLPHTHPEAVSVKEDCIDVGTRSALNYQNSPLNSWDLYRETQADVISTRARPRVWIQADGSDLAYAESLSLGTGLALSVDPLTASLASGMVGYWPLDDPCGSALDTSGNGLNAPRSNAVTLVGDASRFVAPYQCFQSAPAPAMGANDGVSLFLWVYIDPAYGSSYSPGIFTRDVIGAGKTDISLSVNPATGKLQATLDSFGGSPLTVTTSAAPSTNAWHYVRVWWTASDQKIRIQVDGGTPDATVGTLAFPVATSQFTIGGWTDRACYFTGRIKRVGIWDRLLTADEIAGLPAFRYPYARVNVQVNPNYRTAPLPHQHMQSDIADLRYNDPQFMNAVQTYGG